MLAPAILGVDIDKVRSVDKEIDAQTITSLLGN
jgi:hypothetical protein